jgi:hypothetical protein
MRKKLLVVLCQRAADTRRAFAAWYFILHVSSPQACHFRSLPCASEPQKFGLTGCYGKGQTDALLGHTGSQSVAEMVTRRWLRCDSTNIFVMGFPAGNVPTRMFCRRPVQGKTAAKEQRRISSRLDKIPGCFTFTRAAKREWSQLNRWSSCFGICPGASFDLGDTDSMTVEGTTEDCQEKRPVIVFPGGGIYFWWQAGAVKALQECCDLDKCDFAGASAGSLSAVFAACGVNMNDAYALALRLAQEHGVWERREGLAGIWGKMIVSWLDELLPSDAAELCNKRVSISVTSLRASVWPLKRRQIKTFATKDDVIQACMTSVHIPFFIDGSAVRDFKGDKCVDGSLLFFLQGVPWCPEQLRDDSKQVVLCHHEDDATLMAKQWGFLQTLDPDKFEEMYQLGYEYVRERVVLGGLSMFGAMGGAREAAPGSKDKAFADPCMVELKISMLHHAPQPPPPIYPPPGPPEQDIPRAAAKEEEPPLWDTHYPQPGA